MTLELRSGRLDCRQIEALLPPYVDGAGSHADHLTADRAEVRMQDQFGWSVLIPTPASAQTCISRPCAAVSTARGWWRTCCTGSTTSRWFRFVMPDRRAAGPDMAAFGRLAEVLTRDGVTCVLVAPARLRGVAAAVGLEAK